MKKNVLFMIAMLASVCVQAQVMLNLQIPSNGLSVKSQLWNMTLTNSGTTTLGVKIKMSLIDLSSGQQVLTASSNVFSLPVGVKLINYNDILPINYAVLNPNYGIDASPEGFLPIGNFNACFEVLKYDAEVYESILEECAIVQIEPLSPPLLNDPQDNGIIENDRPDFSWIPPAPSELFSNLTYYLKVVEVFNNQQAAEALQQNVPVVYQSNIAAVNAQFPTALPALDTGKLYAWQITANNNGLFVASSEVWTFKVQQPIGLLNNTSANLQAYLKLSTDNTSGYYVCKDVLRFEYNNELNDSSVVIGFYDVNDLSHPIDIGGNELQVSYGQNLIEFNLSELAGFKDKHRYLLRLVNSKNENWTGKFDINK